MRLKKIFSAYPSISVLLPLYDDGAAVSGLDSVLRQESRLNKPAKTFSELTLSQSDGVGDPRCVCQSANRFTVSKIICKSQSHNSTFQLVFYNRI